MVRLKSQHLRMKYEGKKIVSVAAAGGEQHVIREAESQSEERQPSSPHWVTSLANHACRKWSNILLFNIPPEEMAPPSPHPLKLEQFCH